MTIDYEGVTYFAMKAEMLSTYWSRYDVSYDRRDAFLRETCGDNVGLIADLVESATEQEHCEDVALRFHARKSLAWLDAADIELTPKLLADFFDLTCGMVKVLEDTSFSYPHTHWGSALLNRKTVYSREFFTRNELALIRRTDAVDYLVKNGFVLENRAGGLWALTAEPLHVYQSGFTQIRNAVIAALEISTGNTGGQARSID